MSKKRFSITLDLLKEYLEYRDGHLWWIKTRSSNIKVGQQFGWLTKDGYRKGKFFSFTYQEHHLIWFYHFGTWPKRKLDHENCIRNDNRIENLREASSLENSVNRLKHKNSTSQYKGVCWTNNKWFVQASHKGVKYYLGTFECEIEAAKTYDTFAKKTFGEYARLNFSD